MGIGFTLASPGAVAKIIGAWFTKRRALAMSIAGTGSAAGETALVPIAALAVAFIGWREGYLILAGIVGKLVMAAWFILGFIPALDWNKRTIFHMVFTELMWLIPLTVILLRSIKVSKYIASLPEE